ncbi:MAG: hypothetical protein D6737_02435 [Chloroflexi bacterium]|nr:MAG: hypothetical protein CUN54_03195 [Phototrophicales bacterium]RMF82291.1 MAG: hypothetical protein D6737_02435 [Chloroflexota bacterium]
MLSRYRVDVTPGEWRWVTFTGVGLILFAFIPFFLVALTGASSQEGQFMGVFNNHIDGATYLSKMLQGQNGHWLIRFQHTSEDFSPAMIQLLYAFLGQIAGITNIPTIPLFHVARVIASMFMYMAIYYLGATVWMRVRTRKIFFLLTALGGGFGWLLALLTENTNFPDLSIPEAFPLYSSFVNVHFPLAIAALALLAGLIIRMFRPGSSTSPKVDNGGSSAVVLSVSLAILYPQAIVPLTLGLGIYLAIYLYNQRFASDEENGRQYGNGQDSDNTQKDQKLRLAVLRTAKWLALIVLPASPFAVYYAAVVRYNAAFSEWNSQNITLAPSPVVFVLGFGFPLLLALPGIYRAVRQFEPDGDQFMLLWLAAILIAVYAPTNIQRRFSIGIMLPVAYFATRAIEDFWFQYWSRRWRFRAFAAVLAFSSLSFLLVLFVPILPALTGNPQQSEGVFLERDYTTAFQWLENRAQSTDVVLASPKVSIWLPAWAGTRVVYGHPFETLEADAKKEAVINWYQDESAENCNTLLDNEHVRFVIAGPREDELGVTGCLDSLQLIAQFGRVFLYAV